MSGIEYHYTALEDGRYIRLLRLEPADETALVRISIIDADLNEQPAYEALSYTWGSPSNKISIVCSETGCTLLVTRNCEAALRRLRLKEEERTLWIDSICIDQSNILERGRQVQLMSSIYRQAQRVVAYLGEASYNSDFGMDFILEDAASITKKARPSIGLGPGSETSPQQRAIEDIVARQYFQRCWIIQEIVFAKYIEIVLGDKTVSWEAFSRTVSYFGTNKQLHLKSDLSLRPPPVIFYRDRSRSLSTGKETSEMPQSLLEFLRDTRRYVASDPRDKVISLLGMSTEKDESSLAPDYSIDTWNTFLNLTKYHILHYRRLDILCHVQEATSLYNRASWVPDWTIYEHREILGHKKDLVRPYKASAGLPAEVSFRLGPDTLIVKGKVVDIISNVGAEYQLSSTTLKEWEAMVVALCSDRAVDTNTLFIDTLVAYPPYRAPNVFEMFYPAWRRQTVDGETLNEHENAQAAIFREHVNRACNGRSLFVTKNGRVGLGPTKSKKDYVVAVLLGGSVPFILQREDSTLKLVGECYIHGLMNGEAVENSTIDFQMLHLV